MVKRQAGQGGVIVLPDAEDGGIGFCAIWVCISSSTSTAHGDGDTSGLALDCGGTASSTAGQKKANKI